MATEAQIRKEKEEKLQDILRKIGKVAVTYSGGIDSSYLLKVALDTLGPDNVIAAVVNSEMFSNEEFDLALDLADQLGAPVLGLEMRELSDPRIAANTPNIWYYTKQLMYQTIKDSVTELGFKQLVDGNIMDDIDDFRPGIKARDEAGVRSVLQEAGLYKTEIRQLAKERGVSNWNKVPSCSVASRFPYGVKITSENVQRVFEGEEFLVGLGFEQVRVRVHGDLARIEVEEDHLLKAIQLHDKINDYMKKIGFTYVALDLAGYKYGRMNDALDEKTKEKIMAGCLAEILLLDQIPRNIFRGTAQAFATDSLALVLAQEGLEQALDLPVVQRGFFYMPFMHSESLTIHEEALRLFDQPGLEKRLKYEKMHMDILQQFGRYPHRNAILGRPSTKEEEEYLKEHSGF